jgi:hypothetical protein
MYIPSDPEIDIDAVPPLLQWLLILVVYGVPTLALIGAMAYGILHPNADTRQANAPEIAECRFARSERCLSPEFRRTMRGDGE